MFTIDSLLEEVSSLAEAKEIAREMRQTAMVVTAKYGSDHPTAKGFSDRYWNFVDAMAEKFA